jgi:hypothetical protein
MRSAAVINTRMIPMVEWSGIEGRRPATLRLPMILFSCQNGGADTLAKAPALAHADERPRTGLLRSVTGSPRRSGSLSNRRSNEERYAGWIWPLAEPATLCRECPWNSEACVPTVGAGPGSMLA